MVNEARYFYIRAIFYKLNYLYMPFISVPTIAKEKYIKLCHEVYEAKTKYSFMVKTVKAVAYSDAIKDICGLEIWGEIVREADNSFPENTDTCAGIPMTYNPSTI